MHYMPPGNAGLDTGLEHQNLSINLDLNIIYSAVKGRTGIQWVTVFEILHCFWNTTLVPIY